MVADAFVLVEGFDSQTQEEKMTGPQTVLFFYFVAMTVFDLMNVWSEIDAVSIDRMTRRPEYIRSLCRATAHAVAAIAIACWN